MKRLVGIAGALSLAWVSCVALGASAAADDQAAAPKACALTRMASLEITTVAPGTIAVPIKIAGSDRMMRLALNVSNSGIVADLAAQLKLQTRPLPSQIYGLTFFGATISKEVLLPEMQIGLAHGSNVWVLQMPQKAEGDIVGIIGSELLADFDVELDLAHNKMNLYLPNQCDAKPVYWTDSYSALPFERDRVGNIVFIMKLDEKPIRTSFSTASEHAVMPASVTEPLPDVAQTQFQMTRLPAGANRIKAFQPPFKKLSMPGLIIRNPAIKLLDDHEGHACSGRQYRPDGRVSDCFHGGDLVLGLAELRVMHLYFAMKQKVLYVTPADPSAANESLPLDIKCNDPNISARFASDGSDGHATAKISFAINSTAANAVKVAMGSDVICTLTAKPGITIASASFDIDKGGPGTDSLQELLKHVDITEAANDVAGSRSYTFIVKAKDTTPGTLTLDFPVAYRGQP